MFYIYLSYGFVFLAASLVLVFQARLPTGIMPKPVLWWLAGFGVTHGLAEWTTLAARLSDAHDRPAVRGGIVALLVISFVCLAQFGAAILVARPRAARWHRALPVAFLVVWLAIAAAVVAQRGLDGEALRVLDGASRYTIGLPGSLLAACALLVAGRDRAATELHRIGRLLGWAGAAFVAYAVLAGAIAPAAPFFPAARFNADVFRAAMHVPVELFRTVIAAVIAVLMSEAFVIEAARAHTEWERKREEFISVVAHDLRSPIGAIRMAAELLNSKLGRPQELGPERIARILGNIKVGADTLDRMVRDLLDASRIETHRLVLEPREIELRSLVSDVIERSRHATAGHPVTTALPIAAMKIHADPTRVEQVLVNLLSNAAKYSTPDTEIAVEVTSHPDEVEVAVTNHGSGLPPEEARNVFSRFYRSKSHAGQIEGLGLGLYIASGLVQAHGGRIWFDSKLGVSATVHFTLPRASVVAGAARAGSRSGVPPGPDHS